MLPIVYKRRESYQYQIASSNMAAKMQIEEDHEDSNYNFLKAAHNNTGSGQTNRGFEA